MHQQRVKRHMTTDQLGKWLVAVFYDMAQLCAHLDTTIPPKVKKTASAKERLQC